MFLNREGIAVGHKPEEVVETHSTLKTEYIVRLIHDSGYKRQVIEEEVFHSSPTANQVLFCLAKHINASYAVVSERYLMDEELPFC